MRGAKLFRFIFRAQPAAKIRLGSRAVIFDAEFVGGAGLAELPEWRMAAIRRRNRCQLDSRQCCY